MLILDNEHLQPVLFVTNARMPMFTSFIEEKMNEAGHEIGDRFVNEDGEEFMYSVSDFNHGEYAPTHFLISLESGSVRRLYNDIPEDEGFEVA